jgi:hypothetical protein
MPDSTDRSPKPVRSSGTFALGGDAPGATSVHRLGYGAMQSTGSPHTPSPVICMAP